MKYISAAQLSRKHNGVNSPLLVGIFYNLVGAIHIRSQTSAFPKNYKIIDFTTLSLTFKNTNEQPSEKQRSGVKIHLRQVFANHKDVYPEKLTLTTAKPSDRSQMDHLIDESEVDEAARSNQVVLRN